MRRVLLMSVVVFIAACGGGAGSDAKPDSANPKRLVPIDSASASLVQSLIERFGEDAVDACLAAWQDLHDGYADPVHKPGAGFRRFISACVGAPVPADARNENTEAFRMNRPMERPVDLRAELRNNNDVR
jgi:hypothetical protein